MRVGEHFVLCIQANSAEQKLTAPAVALTRVGKQLAAILPNDELAAIRSLVTGVLSKIESAAVHQITQRSGDNVSYQREPIEVIK